MSGVKFSWTTLYCRIFTLNARLNPRLGFLRFIKWSYKLQDCLSLCMHDRITMEIVNTFGLVPPTLAFLPQGAR